MKKLLFGLMIAAVSFSMATVPTVSASAQSTKTYSKTITAADTITFTNVPSKIKAFQYTYDETSGTSAGLVRLYGTINGEWVLIDTLITLADQAAAQTGVVTLSSTDYLSYRIINTNTSSATGTVKASYLRRSDD